MENVSEQEIEIVQGFEELFVLLFSWLALYDFISIVCCVGLYLAILSPRCDK